MCYMFNLMCFIFRSTLRCKVIFLATCPQTRPQEKQFVPLPLCVPPQHSHGLSLEPKRSEVVSRVLPVCFVTCCFDFVNIFLLNGLGHCLKLSVQEFIDFRNFNALTKISLLGHNHRSWAISSRTLRTMSLLIRVSCRHGKIPQLCKCF